MRKVIIKIFAVICCAVLLLTGCKTSETTPETLVPKTPASNEEAVLNVGFTEDYFPQDIVEGFESTTGIKINKLPFNSEEELLQNLQACDVAAVSSLMTDKLRKEGKALEEIDKTQILNYRNISSEFLNKNYDPENKYSVPYLYEHTVLVYNAGMVQEAVTSYSALWREEFVNSVVLVDDARVVFAAALKKQGYSVNETNEGTLQLAEEQLQLLKPNIAATDAAAPENMLISGDAKAGLMLSKQAQRAVAGNSMLKAECPSEGAMVMLFSCVIPKSAEHKNNGYKFINYILDGKINAGIASYLGCGTVNTAVTAYLHDEYYGNHAVTIPTDMVKGAEMPLDLGDTMEYYKRLWDEIKK